MYLNSISYGRTLKYSYLLKGTVIGLNSFLIASNIYVLHQSLYEEPTSAS